MIEQASSAPATLNTIAQMCRTGQSAEALPMARDHLAAARAAGDAAETSRTLTQIAWSSAQLGYPDHAVDYLIARRRLSARAGLRDDALAGAVLAWALVETGMSDEGYAEAERAASLLEGTDEYSTLAFALNCQASSLLYMGRSALAMRVLDRALLLARAHGTHDVLALSLVDVAFALATSADEAQLAGQVDECRVFRERAVTVNNEAIDVASGAGDLFNLRTALCNGAEYYIALGNLERAAANLDRWESLPGVPGIRAESHYLYTRGEHFTAIGSKAGALAVCERAAMLAAAGNQLHVTINSLKRLASAHEAVGDYRAALAAFRGFHDSVQRQAGQVALRRAQLADMHHENEMLRRRADALEEQARRDPLTGVGNRRRFDEALKALPGSCLVLGILDLDRFKTINDGYSHAVGDRVLQAVGQMLLAADGAVHAYRLGGEEFALIMAGVDMADARRLAEALRERIENWPWDEVAPGLRVTASVGLAAADGATPAETLAVADRRLYVAKAAGRNAVVWEDLLPAWGRDVSRDAATG